MRKTVDLEEKGKQFLMFVKEVQQKAESRGLTQEVLNEILNDKS